MPASHSRTWVLGHLAATLIIAIGVLGVGLDRYGMWQPNELRIADAARDGAEVVQRPPLQVALVRFGFQHLGPTERGGRLPTALFAIAATLLLALSVARCTDVRTGMFTGIAYATFPLVFLNARQMFGGGVSQSGFTVVFAALLALVWARPPPDGWQKLAWGVLRWGLLGSIALGVLSAGWMLGVVPVLLGIAVAVALRFRRERWVTRAIAVVFGIGGGVLLYAAMRIIVREVAAVASGTPGVLHGYNPLLGVGTDARAPTQFQTFDTVIEQIGHATFPWTGFALLGSFRLLNPPPVAGEDVGEYGETVADSDADREAGARLGAFMVVLAAFGVQTFHVQQFGPSPFVAAAPLAMACAVLLRDAEREAKPFRMVTAAALFGIVIIARDYILFPKSSYAALGLPDGGPVYPTGFTGKFGDWFHAHPGYRIVTDFFAGKGITEIHVLVWSILFLLVALPATFQGAGSVIPLRIESPYTWLIDVERAAKRQARREETTQPRWKPLRFVTALGIISYLRVWIVAAAGLVMLGSAYAIRHVPHYPLPAQRQSWVQGWNVVLWLPIAIVIAVFAIVLLWEAFRVVGRPGAPWTRTFGSRIAFVPLGGVLVALFITQMFIPALSEHFSPRGVWAVIRQYRAEGEPVARYGGVPSDRATRYYANFDVQDLPTEPEAVDYLRQTTQRRFVVVAGDAFPTLNRAFRASFGENERRNIPVLDVSASNLYIAVSRINSASQNPLDAVVMTPDTLVAATDHWHEHGRRVDGRFVREPARFEDSIEYLGFNLDSGGQSFVPVGGTFRITYHFHVLRQISGDYQMFVHVEGACERQVLDHVPGEGRYPVRLWLPGDFIHDEQRITIPATCRGGRYTIHLGFFQGERRMTVTGGEHDSENRVVAAAINVR